MPFAAVGLGLADPVAQRLVITFSCSARRRITGFGSASRYRRTARWRSSSGCFFGVATDASSPERSPKDRQPVHQPAHYLRGGVRVPRLHRSVRVAHLVVHDRRGRAHPVGNHLLRPAFLRPSGPFSATGAGGRIRFAQSLVQHGCSRQQSDRLHRSTRPTRVNGNCRPCSQSNCSHTVGNVAKLLVSPTSRLRTKASEVARPAVIRSADGLQVQGVDIWVDLVMPQRVEATQATRRARSGPDLPEELGG
jgi:hypothetical protein